LSTRRQPPTVRLRRLGKELRDLRAAAGLTQEEVQERVGVDRGTLIQIEQAKRAPQRRTLTALLNLYDVTDPDRRAELTELSKRVPQPGWLQRYGAGLPASEQYMTYVMYEAEAALVRNYESLFVPGLLQTRNYASAVVAGVLPLASPEEVHDRVQVRIKRQHLLSRDAPLQLHAIIDEAALRRLVGGPLVMREQCQALLLATEQNNVTVQVIPFTEGAHPGMPGSFVIMDFPEPGDPPLVYLDSMAGDLFLDKGEDVERYALTFEHLQALALPPTDSATLIATHAHTAKKGS